MADPVRKDETQATTKGFFVASHDRQKIVGLGPEGGHVTRQTTGGKQHVLPEHDVASNAA